MHKWNLTQRALWPDLVISLIGCKILSFWQLQFGQISNLLWQTFMLLSHLVTQPTRKDKIAQNIYPSHRLCVCTYGCFLMYKPPLAGWVNEGGETPLSKYFHSHTSTKILPICREPVYRPAYVQRPKSSSDLSKLVLASFIYHHSLQRPIKEVSEGP